MFRIIHLFFRILYNASYLTKPDSEKILSYLASADFNFGLVAGVPDSLQVSHKFGERGQVGSKKVQFSDCGIVYFPSSPYLLCVMTKGENTQSQIDAIKTISSSVFKEVSLQKQN